MPREEADLGALQAMVDWTRFLATRTLPVPEPLPSRRGRWIEAVALGSLSYAALCNRRVGLGTVPLQWTTALMDELGALVGQMHRATRDYVVPSGAPRRYSCLERRWLAAPEKAIHASQPAVIQRCHELASALRALPQQPESYGLVHDDLHTGNLVVHQGRLTVIDFECCHYTWFVTDIASALAFATWKSPDIALAERQRRGQRFMQHLWRAYRLEHDLDRRWLRHLPLLLKLREMDLYQSWYAARDLAETATDRTFAYRYHNIAAGIPYLGLDWESLE